MIKNTNDFLNITKHKTGITIEVTTKELGQNRSYVTGHDYHALVKSLKIRNKYFSSFNYMPRYIQLDRAKYCRYNNSASGYSGVSVLLKRHPDDTLKFFVRLRDIETRARTSATIKFAKNKNKKTMLCKAIDLRDKNVEQYNLVTDEYNRLIYNRCIKIAKKEEKTLIPELHNHQFVDTELWEKALDNVFPDGL